MIWLNENASALGIVLAAIPILWAIVQYIITKRAEHKQRRFENYHALIKQLVQGEEGQEKPAINRQIAIVFELSMYPEYKVATKRILEGILQIEGDYNNPFAVQRLIQQVEETIASLESSSWKNRLLK